MLNQSSDNRNRVYKLIGPLLLLICIGTILGLPAIRHAPAIPATVDDLIAAPDTYMDQFVEVHGYVMFVGMNECLGSGQALFSLTRRGRYVYIAANSAFNDPSRPFDPKLAVPLTVRGRLRWREIGPCGLRAARYFDIQEIDFGRP